MSTKRLSLFYVSAGLILFVTATAKLISSFGGALVLQSLDPIFGIKLRSLLILAGLIEMMAALICLFGRVAWVNAGLVAWLATSFLIYRLGLAWGGYHKPCNCLGNLTDALHISPPTADLVMKLFLGYLLLGSYAVIFSLIRTAAK